MVFISNVQNLLAKQNWL